jgi:hypothetical protein
MPHTVVIDTEGIVQAFTTPDQITEQVIAQLLNKEKIAVTPAYDYRTISSSNITETQPSSPVENQVFKVQLGGFIEGKNSEIKQLSAQHFRFVNCTLPQIYQTIFAEQLPLVVDATNATQYLSPQRHELLSFEIQVPQKWQKSLREVAQIQLELAFGLRSKIENRPHKVLLVKKLPTFQALQTYQGAHLGELMAVLQKMPNQDLPVFNETGFAETLFVDMKDRFTRPEDWKKDLENMGFFVEESLREVSCFVLYDPQVATKVDVP